MNIVAHPVTGEVLDDNSIRIIAAELRALKDAIQEHRQELGDLESRYRVITRTLRDYLGVDNHLDCGSFAVVVTPGTPGRRSIHPGVAEEWSEVLSRHGLGKTETKYRPPTLADVNKHRAELVAAGVPMSRLIDQAPQGDPIVEVVVKETI